MSHTYDRIAVFPYRQYEPPSDKSPCRRSQLHLAYDPAAPVVDGPHDSPDPARVDSIPRRTATDPRPPFVASVSNVWKLRAVWNQNMHRENVRVHEDYGPIVRIGPNHVSVADAQSMRAIYGVQNVFRKSAFCPLAEAIYKGRFLPTLFTTESNEYHLRLKRGAVKAFSMDTVVGLEPYVDKCIAVLVSRLREVTEHGKKAVSPVAWLQYFAFDIRSRARCMERRRNECYMKSFRHA
ncbi:cytochrome P450 [Aspergillus egyptiacus]|nr:cytochrome P450 [Aspergillus egyptiacus]